MYQYSHQGNPRSGFSFVELIVTSALILLFFGGLTGIVQSMIKVTGIAKSQSTALALAEERMEYIRSLSYDTIGTIAGVPSGTIPQTRTVQSNKGMFTERILITYVDDSADGVGGTDTNAIITDYKQIKVEYTWQFHGQTKTVSLVSNVMPAGIESTAGGGTIRVNVFDTAAAPIATAEVHFVNNTAVPAIDTIRYTSGTGEAYLSGAPAGSGYEIYVSKPGYSSDGTYTADATVVSPNTPPVSVLVSQVSTMNFLIDRISSIAVQTNEPPTYQSFIDTFTDTSGLSNQSTTDVSGGALVLSDTAGVYVNNGSALSATSTPATLSKWYSLEIESAIPSNTTLTVSVYAVGATSTTLIPNSDLPGNVAGFSSGLIDMQNVSPLQYPSLMLSATLSTADTSVTPQLLRWKLTYITAQNTIGNVDFDVSGQRSYGTDNAGKSVRKYSIATTTNASGDRALTNLAADLYQVQITDSTYSVVEMCPNSPVALAANSNLLLDVTLIPKVSYAERVVVQAANGTPIANASVRLEGSGYDVTQSSSLCGQTFFDSGLTSGNGYMLTVTHPGYTTVVLSGVSITDDAAVTVITLVP